MGIVVALVVCTATSGGHFSPGVTLVHLLFNRFPPAKAIRSANSASTETRSDGLIILLSKRYIIAQILGGFIASMLVYWQWNTLIKVSSFVPADFGAAVTVRLHLGEIYCSFFHRTQKQRSGPQACTRLRTSRASGLPVSLLCMPTLRHHSARSFLTNSYRYAVAAPSHEGCRYTDPEISGIGLLYRHRHFCLPRSDELLYAACRHTLDRGPDIVSNHLGDDGRTHPRGLTRQFHSGTAIWGFSSNGRASPDSSLGLCR